MKKANPPTELIKLLTQLRTSKDAAAFLADFLTPCEISDLIRRWQIVKLLNKGVPHRNISQQLKVSIAKVTRGSHALKESKGAFKKFLKKK